MILQYSLTTLQKKGKQTLDIQETLDVFPDLKQRLVDLIAASMFQIKGQLTPDPRGWWGHFKVKGTLTLPSTRSLAPVSVPIEFTFDETYVLTETPMEDHDEGDLLIPIEGGVVDVLKAVEDNIILAIPTQILTPDEQQQHLPQGNGWSVLSESEFKKTKQDTQTQQTWSLLADLAQTLHEKEKHENDEM